MVADLALAIVGTVDVCVRLADKALTAYRAYRGAETAIDEKVILLEAHWTKLETQLRFLTRISDHLDARLAESQFNLLQRLHGKLVQATAQIGLEMPSSKYLRKIKYALIKERLEELVTDLEAWQQRFDPTWYLIILIGSNVIDNALTTATNAEASGASAGAASPLHSLVTLRQAVQPGQNTNGKPSVNISINLDAAGLRDSTYTPVSFSGARIVARPGTDRLLIAETVDFDVGQGSVSQVKQDVESLAKKLKSVDPTIFGLLQCRGVLKHRKQENNQLNGLEMIYRTPEGSRPPTSLRDVLLIHEKVSVTALVRLATQLVLSVSYVHACDFVHKNIRPENILVFPPEDPKTIGQSFLLGFNHFRNQNYQTNLTGDQAWHRNLYRHPQRQGLLVLERYVMQHDIYSLGVCLLEIGLWRSFVWYPNNGKDVEPVPGLALKMILSDADFRPGGSDSVAGGEGGGGGVNGGRRISPNTKARLIELANEHLPSRLGDIYTGVVLACLTCLDEGNTAFGSEADMMDEDGVLVGVRFIEKILLRIADISV